MPRGAHDAASFDMLDIPEDSLFFQGQQDVVHSNLDIDLEEDLDLEFLERLPPLGQ